ncbi:uncharacterized protein LOC117118902 [Anneissia japonica]|uniref:uncharacterized protein LOC117118902 n=1 Tax=Anneissia japonica TaxID=1529436 RepID=UPI0014256639|nr:uncharacterized protein LOC117118902 [Anneissia japonica]
MAEPHNDLVKDGGSIQKNSDFQKVPQTAVKLDDHSMMPITKASNISAIQEPRGVKTPEKLVAGKNSLKTPGAPFISESDRVQNGPVTSKIPTNSNTSGNLRSKLKTPKAIMKYTSDTPSMSTPSSTPRKIIQQPRSIKKPKSKSDDLFKASIESNSSSAGKLKYSGFPEEQQIPKQRTLQMPKSSSKKTVSLTAASKLPITSRPPQVSKLPLSSRTQRKKQENASKLSMYETSGISQLKPRSFTRATSPSTKVLKYQSASDKRPSVLQKRSTKSQHTASSCISNDKSTPNTGLLSQEPGKISEKCISETKSHVGPTIFALHDNLQSTADSGCKEEINRAKEVIANSEKDAFPGNEGQRQEEVMDVVARLLERKKQIECNQNVTTSKAHKLDNKISGVEDTREESDKSNKMSKKYAVPKSHLPDNETSRLGVYSKVDLGNSSRFTASNVSVTSKPTKITSSLESSSSIIANVKSASPGKTFGYSSTVNTKVKKDEDVIITKIKASIEQQSASSRIRKVVPSMAIQKAEEGIIKEPLKRSLTYPSNSGNLQHKAIPKPSPKILKLRAPSQASTKLPRTLPTPHTSGQKSNQQCIKPSTSRNVKVVNARPLSSATTVPKLAVPQTGKQNVKRASSTGSKILSAPQSKRNSSNHPSIGFTKLKPGQISPSCRIVKPVIRPPSVKVEEQKGVQMESLDIVMSDKDKVHSDSEEKLTVTDDEELRKTHFPQNVMFTYPNDVSDNVKNSTVESIIIEKTSANDLYQQESGENDAELLCKVVQSHSDDLQNLSEAEDVDFDSMWSEIAKESQMIRQDILSEASIKPSESGIDKEDALEVEESNSFNNLENNFNPKIILSDLENHQRCDDNLLQETCKENQFLKISDKSDKLYQTKVECEDADSSKVRENEQQACEQFEISDQNDMPNHSNLPSSKKEETEKEPVSDNCPTVKRRMWRNTGTTSLTNTSDLQQTKREDNIHQSSDIKYKKPDVQVVAESSSVEVGTGSSDENREFEELEMQINLEEDSESSKISASSPKDITYLQLKSTESTGIEDMATQPAKENGKGLLRTSTTESTGLEDVATQPAKENGKGLLRTSTTESAGLEDMATHPAEENGKGLLRTSTTESTGLEDVATQPAKKNGKGLLRTSTTESAGLKDVATQAAKENGNELLRTSNRGQSLSSISNIDNLSNVSFLSEGAPLDKLSSNMNTQIKSTKARPSTLKFNLSQTTRETPNSSSTSTPRKPLEGIDYTPPYAVNIPTSKYPIRNSQTCPPSPTFNWFPRDQEKTSLSDSGRRHHRQSVEKSKMSVRDLDRRRFSLPLSSFTCPSTPSFGESLSPHHFMFPINEEGYNEDEVYYNYDLDLSSHAFHNLTGEKLTDLDVSF